MKATRHRLQIQLRPFTKGSSSHFFKFDGHHKGHRKWYYVDTTYDPDLMYRVVTIGENKYDPNWNQFVLASRAVGTPLIKAALQRMGVEEFIKSGIYGQVVEVTEREYTPGEFPAMVVWTSEDYGILQSHIVLS